jgi:protein involved in polysaccharide export with SLBB domain
MNKHQHPSIVNIGLEISVLLIGILCAIPGVAQGGRGRDGKDENNVNRSRAIDQAESRAERAAEDMVFLSADRIIGLLQQEPGLLLQVKKTLVRKAYEQGRLLDPQDLTDESLFRLIREDYAVRVVVTREIEDRNYIRAKPTREELERERQQQRVQVGVADAAAAQAAAQIQAELLKGAKNQEEVYWSRHDDDFQRGMQQDSAPSPTSPPSTENPQAPGPQVAPPDYRRDLLRAGAQSSMGDPFDGMSGDFTAMPRVSPEQLPALLSASTTDGFTGGAGNGMGQLASMGGMNETAGLSRMGGGGTSNFAFPVDPTLGASADLMQGQEGSGFQRPPGLDNRMRPQPTASPRAARPLNPVLNHRPNPYADVPSLYDLYSQYSARTPMLERFGQDIFRNGTGNFDMLPMDLPVGPEYVLGPGDGLSIDIWGSISRRLQRVVDRSGRVSLPEVGLIEVSGRNLGDVQHLLQSALRTEFREVQADVSLSRLRTVRVYVVGDVERAGAYDVSSLSTPLNALFLAGGPTSRGSLRVIRHYRGKQLVQAIDLYDLLLHGIRSGVEGLQPGDTIMVPTPGPQVKIEGMVRRPAIYELGGEKNLAEVLELAGGVMQSGTLRHVDVERVEAHVSRTMLRLDIPESDNQESINKALEAFTVQDGDKIKISPILPYADKTVYLDGHVFHPGKFAYKEGMKVADIIQSYHDLLPEPYKRHAEIIRLNPPDYTPVIMAFNLDDALTGKDQNLVLKPFDTIRVFGRLDFEDAPVITVSGEVRDPGDHITNGAAYLRDAIYLAGGTTPDAELSDIQVFRKTEDGKLKVISVNLSKAMAGDATDNVLLEPKDRVFVHRNLAKFDPPSVKIEGEVARPGKYPLGDGMTAADLVRVAGSFKRGAYTEAADLTRYELENGTNVSGEHLTVPIASAMAGAPDSDVRLHDGDVLTIRQVAGWNGIGATITVKGEVRHPGTYGIKEGERLSSIIARAGGFGGNAYPYGAIFERVQVRELEEKNRAQLIREVQDEGATLKATPSADGDDKLVKDASLLQWKTTLEKLQNTPPAGRLVVHISSETKRWANTPYDIQVRAGDVIHIPPRPSVVVVDGSVYNPTAVTFKPGRSAGWYLRQAGGPTNMANKKAIFVIRADGSVAGGEGSLLSGGVESTQLQAGDMVVVPEKAFSGTSKWKNAFQVSQILQGVAIAVSVGKTF